LGEILVVPDVGEGERRRQRVAPRCLVMAATVNEQIEMELPLHRAILIS
jgi:hypothetical protein